MGAEDSAQLADQIAKEYARLLEEGWDPDIDEFLQRVPEEHREECRGRIQRLTEESISVDLGGGEAPPTVEVTPEAEVFVEEYRRILDDGFEPDVEEFLQRVPEDLRDEVHAGIQHAGTRAPGVRSALDELYAAGAEPAAAPEPEAVFDPEPEPEPEPEPVSRLLYPDIETGAGAEPPAVYESESIDDPGHAPDYDEEPLAAEPEPHAEAEMEPEPYEEAEVEPEPYEEPALVLEERAPGGPPEIPGFRIDAVLGQGALGDVYAAWEEARQRRVALKLIQHPGAVGKARERILNEASRAAGLEDPAIVAIHSVTDLEGTPAIIMELAEGEPIDEAAASLDPKRQARIFLDVARAIAAAHDEGILHRDLKPQSILVTPDLKPKIVGFGLALSMRDQRGGEGSFSGTPHYATPEHATGMQRLSPASDIWSLGAVMYTVLTGRPPFEGDDPAAVLNRIANEDPPFPRDLAPGVPLDLQAICLACLARTPRRRPTAREVMADLRRFLAGEPARLRPALYRDAVQQGAAEQVANLRVWADQGIVSGRERDRLESVYRRMLSDEDHWVYDNRRLSVPQTVLYAGAWMAAVGAALLTWLARDDLSALARWAVPAGACAALFLFGFVARLRREPVAAAAMLAGAALTLLPAGLAALVQFDVLPGGGEGPQLFADTPFTNLHVLAATGGALVLSLLGWSLTRMTAFAWTSAGLLAAAWCGFVVWRGGLELPAEQLALRMLPLLGLAVPALACEKVGRARWALPFHLGAFLALLVVPAVLARNGATLALLGLEVESPRDVYLGFALTAAALLVVMLVLERMRSVDLRRGARALQVIVPVVLLGSLYLNADATGAWSGVGMVLGAAAFLLVLAPWRSRRWFLAAGLVGLALGSYLLVAHGLVAAAPLAIGLCAAGVVLPLGAYLHLRRGQ